MVEPYHHITTGMVLSEITAAKDAILNASGADIINAYGGQGKPFILDGKLGADVAGGAAACIAPNTDTKNWNTTWSLCGVADVSSNGGTFYGVLDANGTQTEVTLSQTDAAFMAYGAAEMMVEGPNRYWDYGGDARDWLGS